MNITEAPPDLEYHPKLPREKSIGIGCIGAGFIMDACHLVAYRKAGFRPVAIAARDRGRTREVAARHGVPRVYDDPRRLAEDPEVEVIDIAVPPDEQPGIIRQLLSGRGRIRGILAQKPLAGTFTEAREIVRSCEQAGVTLAVNQNMRYDQSMRACKCLLSRGDLGTPVLATIEMRAIPHWMPWHERLGYLTLRNMSIHHLDAYRFLFGEPESVYASIRPDPRTGFAHDDGICLYILEYACGMRAAAWDDIWAGPDREGTGRDTFVRWRVEGTEGLALGTIGWPSYPAETASTMDYTTTMRPGEWHRPRWEESWFPDAFIGTMAQLLCAIEEGREPEISGRDNLGTIALVEACYRSARERRAIAPSECVDEQD